MAKHAESLRETWRRLRRLPVPARAAGLVMLGSGALPAAASLVAVAGGSAVAHLLAAHPAVVNLAAGCIVVEVLLVFEPPRSASPIAYARQLRTRVLELQSTFDAEDQRRPWEGKEKEDDRSPSEP